MKSINPARKKWKWLNLLKLFFCFQYDWCVIGLGGEGARESEGGGEDIKQGWWDTGGKSSGFNATPQDSSLEYSFVSLGVRWWSQVFVL